ncbi:MAG: phosphonate metabolism protein/1,5-bisphosphokinase (PRPP-forming) PhnN [Bacteroidota bacterium]
MNSGTLFYVVGASGAGKDSLMNFARKNLSVKHVKFAIRHITRPADAGGEAHIATSHEEFQQLMEQSFFSLFWESHGNRYGISKEINQWLNDGINVVVNGSRGYLPTALSRYPNLKTVLIEVSEHVMRKRLTGRGRESNEEIEDRIKRSKTFQNFDVPGMVRINNDRALELSGAEFVSVISALPREKNAFISTA